ncbi:unnamed protein product [Caenorhabditis auriculariae]|uniref:Uncharacterized protein n=1 Tax=Caenorhabditis auriculariae TaxID=2777116 RepID=A0A8S1HJH1_9PELO|nr:unnamed protein product [Caenorhabditis auriculariae]
MDNPTVDHFSVPWEALATSPTSPQTPLFCMQDAVLLILAVFSQPDAITHPEEQPLASGSAARNAFPGL